MQTNGEIKKDTSTGDRRYPCNIAYTELAPCRALVNLRLKHLKLKQLNVFILVRCGNIYFVGNLLQQRPSEFR